MKNGIKKVIKIKVNGTECFDISLSVELGKLLLNRDLPQLQSVKKIFIIYAVFYASSISVSVMIGKSIIRKSRTKILEETREGIWRLD